MDKRSYVKEAVVLLLTFVMISSTLAMANTHQSQPALFTTDAGAPSHSSMRDVAWDNGLGLKLGALAAQYYPGDIDAFPVDDFKLDSTYDINSVSWQGGYYNCQYAAGAKDYGFIWNITFYNHNATGNKPGTVYKEFSFDNASITHAFWYTTNVTTRWYANYSVTLDEPVQFLANTQYWISIYAYNMTFPQTGWSRHNDTQMLKGHEGMFKSEYFGYPDWVNASVLLAGVKNDFNFALGGTVATAPVLAIETIKGPIGVKATIKNTGDAAATNVSWNIALTGGTIFFGGAKNGTIPSIDAAGGIGTAKIPIVLGFGKTVIGVTVTCDQGASASKEQNATVLLFLVLTK